MSAALSGEEPPPQGWPPARIRRKDGTWAWLAGNPSLYVDPATGETRAMSVNRDMTETVRLRAEMDATLARLRESEALYRLVTDNAPDAILHGDAQGVIRFASPGVRAFGYEPEQMVGRDYLEFIAPADFTGDVARAMRRRQPVPSGEDNEFHIRRADGGWALVQGNPAPTYDDEGRLTGWVVVIRDVTERRAMINELRRRTLEAQTAVLAKAEFLANMSHEIRTPLTAVVGFAELMAKIPDLPEKAKVYAERIARSGDALTSIVNNVLDFSKVEAGQVTLRPEPFDFGSLAEEVLATVEQAALEKRLRVALAGEPPAGRIIADAGRLRQIMLNLVSNAVKFTHQGTVTLWARHDPLKGRLRVAIEDTGIGVAEDMRKRLFERFSQAESSSARRFGGTGLGLAITKGLVELMDGTIGYEPLEPMGSRFWFEIPAPAETMAQDALGEPPLPPLPPLKVLVVDDVTTNRELILALLEPFGATIHEAASGAEALEAARAEAFDLILMDLQMPGMDGIAATRAIRRSKGPCRAAPILAVSASVLPADVMACRAAGMSDHVPKPICPRTLIEKIAYWAPTGPGAVAAPTD
jgi:PAS domain S-box-containing protein